MSKNESKSLVKIQACVCANDFQDRKYGIGRRVWNKSNESAKTDTTYRCTVCGRER